MISVVPPKISWTRLSRQRSAWRKLAGTWPSGRCLPRPAGAAVTLLDSPAHGLPIRTGTEILSVEARDCGYDLVTATGRMAARAVVVASGGRAVHDPGGLLASPR